MRTIQTLLLLVFVSLPLTAQAWDSVGHRLSAAVALQFLDTETREQLLTLLTHHPRYEEDFLAELPAFVDREDREQFAQWMLGQAAYWPDIARGLPEAEQRRYNRPAWHYTDGARVRGSALSQGNVYLGIDAFDPIQGPRPETISEERQADNVVTALDYNTGLLADPDADDADRAVALCWVLHLMGDIHQPLHTGSLFSETLFANGDRGGNAIPIAEDSNLHAVWDRALREFGVAGALPDLIAQVSGFTAPRIEGAESDWTAWMEESRQLLHSTVYSPALRQAILAAEASGSELPPIELDSGYRARMQSIARLRLALAGLRLAIWFENELP